MVDIAAKRAEGKGRDYEKWATMHNLKQMAATLAAYQQYGFSSPNELDAALTAAHLDMQESLAGLKELEATIRDKKELQRNLLIGTKPARDGLKAQKSEKARRAYREQHQSDFILAESAARYFREHSISKLPASKALQREIEQLTVQKNFIFPFSWVIQGLLISCLVCRFRAAVIRLSGVGYTSKRNLNNAFRSDSVM